MLRYDRSPKRPRNYLARTEQWRVLKLVLALGLVIILMRQITSPRAIGVLATFFGQPQPVDDANARRAATNDAASQGGIVAPQQLPGQPFDEIKDNSPFRSEETSIWYEWLAVLASADAAHLDEDSVGEVSAVQLLRQPDAYRGKLVTIGGTARQCVPLDPLGSDLTPTKLAAMWQGSMAAFVDHSLSVWLHHNYLANYHRIDIQQKGARVPTMVYVLNIPSDFPRGDSLNEPVSVTGYFFKNWLFSAEGELDVGPALLAKRVNWHAPPQQPAENDSVAMTQMVLTIGVAILVAVGIFLWLMRKSGGDAEGTYAMTAALPDRIDVPADSWQTPADHSPQVH